MSNNQEKKWTAVLLAAGLGSRLGDLTKNKPKPLLELGGKSLLAHAISWCHSLGASKIVVVGGYKIDLIRNECAIVDSNVIVVENREYATTQRLVSLLCAVPEIEGGLYMCDADYYFDPVIADKTREGFTGMVVFGCARDKEGIGLDMRAQVTADGFLLDMSKELSDWNAYFCTQLFIESEFVPEFISLSKELVTKAGHGRLHVEDVVMATIHQKEKSVRFVDLGDPKWAEIDTPEEYEAAQRLFFRGFLS